ncbi:MAG: nuclear transport factor 2 family protein [Marinifilaceae bacterium]|jgi:hypothetical protein|nr:nuclear transport factor 2 family protein [Marinifilaceae bacterium]
MKTILFSILTLLSFNINAKNMDKILINETVAKLFIATDNRDWKAVEDVFADVVLLDYSSFGAGAPANLKPKQITSSWKAVLPGFQFTHHQSGNFVTSIKSNLAHVFCYGTATHYLENEKGNVWTVVGSYDFELIQEKGSWKIKSMKFNFKYQDGNLDLSTKAIENCKK